MVHGVEPFITAIKVLCWELGTKMGVVAVNL